MKRHIPGISALLFFVVFSFSCASVGYMDLDPDIDKSKKMFPYGLNIVFGNKIKSEFVMHGSVRNVSVDGFRKTLGDLFKKAFEMNYRDVTVSDMPQNKGVELVFNRFEPYQIQHTDGIKIGVRLQAEVLKDGVFKFEIRGEDEGDYKAVLVTQIGKAMESSLQKMVRKFYDKYMEMAEKARL